MTEFVTVDEAVAWVGRSMADPVDADAMSTVADAVNTHLGQLIGPTIDPVPEDLHFAGLLLASRWYSRRNSPDGLVGFSDGFSASIRSLDPDIRDVVKKYQRRTVG